MKVSITLGSALYTSECSEGMSFDLILGTVMKGDTGDPGKSAYKYAQEGGFKGTEKQFTTALASQVLVESIGSTNEVSI